MPIQLAIQYKNGETENRFLDQETIKIGRNNRLNDIVLKTEEVSREHACITWRNGAAYFSCQGKFGAALNDRALTAGEELQLQFGDRIVICGNILTMQEPSATAFFELTQPTGEAAPADLKMPASEPEIMAPPAAEEALTQKASLTRKAFLRNRYSTDLMNESLLLAKELDTLYRNNVTEISLVRKQKLKEALKNHLMELDKTGRLEMIDLLKERFCTRYEDWKRLIQQDKELKAQEGKKEQTRATLELVAQNLMENSRPFQSEAEWAAFGENLQQTMLLLLELFRDLEANRQKNFETALAPNQSNTGFPLEQTTPLKKIGGLWLDWSTKEESRKARQEIENNLRKLRFHEQALKAGYEEGLLNVSRRLLQRLNPETFESEVRSERLKFKIFQKLLGPLLDWLCWRRYQKAFQELRNQEGATFQKWFDEEFELIYQSKIERLAGLKSGAGAQKK